MTTRILPAATLLVLGLTAAAMPGAAEAQQPHFTIRVPVTLHDIHPDVSAVQVWCSLYDGGVAATPWGAGSASLNLGPDRGYQGPPVELTFEADGVPEETLLGIDEYRCSLRLLITQHGITLPQPPAPGSQILAARPKSGTTFIGEVSGPIQHD